MVPFTPGAARWQKAQLLPLLLTGLGVWQPAHSGAEVVRLVWQFTQEFLDVTECMACASGIFLPLGSPPGVWQVIHDCLTLVW